MFLSLPGVKRTDQVQDEPSFEIYFQSDSRAAGMKDLVREFIRKATMVCVCACECTCMCLHVNRNMTRMLVHVRHDKRVLFDLVCCKVR